MSTRRLWLTPRCQAQLNRPGRRRKKKKEFRVALEEFNTYLAEVSKKVQVDFDVKDGRWSDVLEQLKEADDTMEERLLRDQAFWSKGARWLTGMSNLFRPGLQVIPDEFCFVHGALALVLHLANSREKTKQNIMIAFGDVTETIATAGTAAEHHDDARLFDSLDALRITLFRTIPQLINILLPKKILAVMSIQLKSPKAERLLEEVRYAANRVKMRAQTLSDRHNSEAAKITKDHVEEIHHKVHGVHKMQQDIWDIVSCAFASQEGLKKMLHEAVEMFQYHKGSSVISSPTSPSSTTSDNNFKLSMLQSILNVKRGHEEQDLVFVRRQDSVLDAKSKSTAGHVFVHPNFQRWMVTNEPDLIHVEGRLEGLHGKTSPISYFCAGLVDAFRELASTVVLHFFCGQHMSSNDELRGPQGVMRSLVVQVLRACPMVSLADLDLEAFGRKYETIRLDYLCDLFKLVVGQIPTNYTVYCIIDDISGLEKDEWVEEYWGIMQMFQDLVKGAFADVRFKVLMTSPGRSRRLRGDNEVHPDRKVAVTDSGLPLRDERVFGK